MLKEETDQILEKALFQLMEKKPFDRITYQDLAERSGISRATIYRHFSSLADIVNSYLERLASATSPPSSIWKQGIQEAVFYSFSVLVKEKGKLQILRKQNMLDLLRRKIYEISLDQIKTLDVLNNRYQPYYFAGAAAAVISAWLQFDMEESPARMTELFIRSLHGYMPLK